MGRFADIADEISMNTKQLVDELLKAVNEELDEADKNTYTEYAAIESKKIKEIFDNAVTEFYNDYPNPKYKRRGDPGSKSGGLYDVFDSNYAKDEYGIFDDESDPWFNTLFNGASLLGDPERDYDGEPLFQKVFMEGWHGGAESIAKGKTRMWRPHPSPGTPYYRARGLVHYPRGIVKWHKYGKWGLKAKKSEAPYETFKKAFRTANDGELEQEFIRLDDKNFELAMERFQRRQEEIEDRIFG